MHAGSTAYIGKVTVLYRCMRYVRQHRIKLGTAANSHIAISQ
jgi:hypothetical protein